MRVVDFEPALGVIDPSLRDALRRGGQAVEFLDGIIEPIPRRDTASARSTMPSGVSPAASAAHHDPLRQRRLDAAPEARASLALPRGANDLVVEPAKLLAQFTRVGAPVRESGSSAATLGSFGNKAASAACACSNGPDDTSSFRCSHHRVRCTRSSSRSTRFRSDRRQFFLQAAHFRDQRCSLQCDRRHLRSSAFPHRAGLLAMANTRAAVPASPAFIACGDRRNAAR